MLMRQLKLIKEHVYCLSFLVVFMIFELSNSNFFKFVLY